MKSTLLLSTGGTFNKIYNPINGSLEIDSTCKAIESIQKSWLSNYPCDSIINKDSLKFNNNDRENLLKFIQNAQYKRIVIIHGTDTMHLSAQILAKANLEKSILFTGAMVPFSIDPIEATANLASAIGFIHGLNKHGVYIAMNGRVESYNNIKKNRTKGFFELTNTSNA